MANNRKPKGGGEEVAPVNPKLHEAGIEQCLTVADIAQKLKLSDDTVRRIFINEEGVTRIGHETLRVERKYRRHYFTLLFRSACGSASVIACDSRGRDDSGKGAK